jgi:hypothetical protein
MTPESDDQVSHDPYSLPNAPLPMPTQVLERRLVVPWLVRLRIQRAPAAERS